MQFDHNKVSWIEKIFFSKFTHHYAIYIFPCILQKICSPSSHDWAGQIVGWTSFQVSSMNPAKESITRVLHLLEPPARLTGIVASGCGRGSKLLGYPTANITSDSPAVAQFLEAAETGNSGRQMDTILISSHFTVSWSLAPSWRNSTRLDVKVFGGFTYTGFYSI